jgi:hypothetical protein
MSRVSGDHERLKRVLGEGFVIVVSILLAFSIDAWWDRAQQKAAKAEWIAAVQFDLQTSLSQVEETIGQAEAIVGATSRLLALLSSTSTPPVDSIRHLADEMTRPIGFTPTLPGFERGFSEGRFSVIESVEFRRGLADFRQFLVHFEDARRLDWDTYFTGPLYAIRAPHGGLQLLGLEQRERFQMTDAEYLEVMLAPETFAAIETMGLAQQNELWGLEGMRGALEAMVSSLEGGAR